MTQFAWAPGIDDTGPYYQCIALSTSSDALGSDYRYLLDVRAPGDVIAFPRLSQSGCVAARVLLHLRAVPGVRFWYTQQYIAATGAFDWRARIADFKFINCK